MSSNCTKADHNARTHDRVLKQRAATAQQLEVPPTARVEAGGRASYACTICGAQGHNAHTHHRQAAAAEPAEPATRRQQTCGTCGQRGHNVRTHHQHVAAEPAAAEPAEPITRRQQTCGTCGQRGHNVRTHHQYVAAEAEAAEGGREKNIEDLEREQAVKGRRGKRPQFANFTALLATLPPLVSISKTHSIESLNDLT